MLLEHIHVPKSAANEQSIRYILLNFIKAIGIISAGLAN